MKSNIKLTFAALLTIAALLLGSCKEKERQEVTFDVSFSEITAVTAECLIEPSDAEAEYYVGLFPSSVTQGVEDDKLREMVLDQYQKYEIAPHKGKKSIPFSDLTPETSYTVLTFSFVENEYGKLHRNEFKTLEEEGGSGDLEDLKEMTITIGEKEIKVGSVILEDYAGYLTCTLTEEEGLESLDDLIESGVEYFQVLVVPSLLNKEFDILTQSETFTIISTLEDATIAGLAPGNVSEATAGKVRFDFTEPDAELFASITLTDGTTVSARAKGTYSEPIHENLISVNGETKPLRAAFYGIEEGSVYLYFTPADIEYFTEIESATYYVAMVLDQAMLTGNDIDIENVEVPFSIYLMDNVTGDAFVIEGGNGGETTGTGTLSVSQSGSNEAEFAVSADLSFNDGPTLEITFDGECTSMYSEPEQKNEFVIDGVATPIMSAIVDLSVSGETKSLWLSGTEGLTTVEAISAADPLHITFPEDVLNIGPAGFSQWKTLSFIYGERTWSKENGNNGTLEIYLDGTALQVSFTTYSDLDGYFKGEAIVIE